MNIDDKKINVDDISFDDLIDGGIEDSLEQEKEEDEANDDISNIKEDVPENDLDSDAEIKAEKEEEEEPVQKTSAKKETSEKIDDSEEEEEQDDSIIGEVLSSLGYKVDEKYEDTTEGLVSLTKDIGAQMADDTLDKLFEQHPLVGKHLEYVMNGGKSEEFMTTNDPREDYSKMELKEDDSRSQKTILSEYFRLKGHDKEFKGISIPEREKTKFFDYLSKPVTKEGYTQRDLDHNGSEMDTKLAIDYLMYKGFNLDKLIDKKARTKSTRALKDKIKGHKESLKSAKKASRAPSTSVDIDNLDLQLF